MTVANAPVPNRLELGFPQIGGSDTQTFNQSSYSFTTNAAQWGCGGSSGSGVTMDASLTWNNGQSGTGASVVVQGDSNAATCPTTTPTTGSGSPSPSQTQGSHGSSQLQIGTQTISTSAGSTQVSDQLGDASTWTNLNVNDGVVQGTAGGLSFTYNLNNGTVTLTTNGTYAISGSANILVDNINVYVTGNASFLQPVISKYQNGIASSIAVTAQSGSFSIGQSSGSITATELAIGTPNLATLSEGVSIYGQSHSIQQNLTYEEAGTLGGAGAASATLLQSVQQFLNGLADTVQSQLSEIATRIVDNFRLLDGSGPPPPPTSGGSGDIGGDIPIGDV